MSARVFALGALMVALGCSGGGGAIEDAAPTPDGRIYPEHDARVGVDCLGKLCAPGEPCCYEVFEGGPKPSRITHCASSPDLSCSEVTYLCDGPEDCDAGVCCAIDTETWTCADPSACITPPTCHAEIDCGPNAACCPSISGIIKVCLSGGCGGQ